MQAFNCSHRSLTGIVAAFALLLAVPQITLAQATGTTAYGIATLNSNTSAGQYNAAFGSAALFRNTTGSHNTAIGSDALHDNVDGNDNTAIGVVALGSNTRGYDNTASGKFALYLNTSGIQNTAIGVDALSSRLDINSRITGWGNTAIGYNSLSANTTGHNNVALGYGAGSNTQGSNNVSIRNAGDSGDNNTIRIGTNQSRVFIAGISGTTTDGCPQVLVNSDGQLGTVNSSERFKKDIKPIDDVNDKLLQLRPVSFIYKDDESKRMQYGLIAEEVAKVYPELVQYDQEGKPFTVYYHLLTPLLLSELQKEHEQVTSQQTQLTDMQAITAQQQVKLNSREQQLNAERAEMLAMLQQQRQQHVVDMGVLQQKLNKLNDMIQAGNSSNQPSEKLALMSGH